MMIGVCLVDQGDRAVLQLAGGIALGVDIADFLQLQRAFQGQRGHRAAAEDRGRRGPWRSRRRCP